MMEPRSGSAVTGTATFTQAGSGPVHVSVQIENATPGLHGLHVHETGDCSDPAAASAGGHLNPAAAGHAGLQTQARHAGDLGNIEIREDGKGDMSVSIDLLTISAGRGTVVGRAIVFHASQDDLVTQPTGNSGARQACGVITTTPR